MKLFGCQCLNFPNPVSVASVYSCVWLHHTIGLLLLLFLCCLLAVYLASTAIHGIHGLIFN